jgi:hypothetical protein
MAEDLCREAGYLLPQSENTRELLQTIRTIPDVPKETIDKLLKTLQLNEKE